MCSHCGGKKHTKEGCFLLVGYPEWWDDMKKQRAARAAVNRTGRAAITVADRATDAVRTTGNSGGGAAHGKKASGGCEKSGVEEIAFAQAANWVCEGGNEPFHFNPPNFANIQIAPSSSMFYHTSPDNSSNLQFSPNIV